MGESNTKKSNQQHISIKTTKETPTLKEDLKQMAKSAGLRFNDFMNKILSKCVESAKNEGNK